MSRWSARPGASWTALKEELSRRGWLAFLVVFAGGSLLSLLLIPWGASGPRASGELFATIAQVDVGLLIALAIEGRVDNEDRLRDEVTSIGAAGVATSLLLAITGLILVTDGNPSTVPATWRLQSASSFFAVFAVGGMFWGAAMLVSRLLPRARNEGATD